MRIIITGCDGIFIVIHIIDVQSNQMGLSLNPGLSLQRDLRSSGRGLQWEGLPNLLPEFCVIGMQHQMFLFCSVGF